VKGPLGTWDQCSGLPLQLLRGMLNAAASLLSNGDKEARATDMAASPSIRAACSVGQGRCTIGNNIYDEDDGDDDDDRSSIPNRSLTSTAPPPTRLPNSPTCPFPLPRHFAASVLRSDSDLKLTQIDSLQSYPRPHTHAHGSSHPP